MRFTSGKISHDPLPWRLSLNNGATYRTAERERLDYDYDPRARYDNHNPILVWLRAASEDRVMRAQYGPSLVPLLAGDFLVPGMLEDYTPAQITHARRVLTKLAALA